MYILGISCYYHDSAACLLKDGDLIVAAEEERFSRIKHDFSFPANAIKFCLEFEGIKSEELDYVIFHEKPFLKLDRIIKTVLATYPKSHRLFKEAALHWMKEKLWIKAKISEFLNVKPEKILFSQHHLSHAASAFFCSPFEESAILTCDGVGEWATTTLGYGKADWKDGINNNIQIIEEIQFPHSLGLLYSVFTAFLGFKINEGEYKVMGLSAYGKPRYKEKIYELIKVNSDGSFKLNMKYFSYHHSTTKCFNEKFIKLFGSPFPLNEPLNLNDGEFQRYADIAASIQEVTEEILIKIVNYLYRKTNLKKLCFAGGVALNCVANYKILVSTPFEEIYIQPAAGDAGTALGAALYLWHCLLKKPRSYVMRHAYWGKGYQSSEIENFLEENSIHYHKLREEELVNYVVDALLKGKIVGWYQGRFEWGPRALGNRSILADPRSPLMKEILNFKVKFREPFRPFAPTVIAEKVQDLFEISDSDKHYPLKFMLYTIPVKEDRIPSATHIDGTARIQKLYEEDNPIYYRLIEKFYEKSGVPAILNTSFNTKGEPIVNSPCDALATFKRSEIDVLVLNEFVIERNL